MLITFIRHSKVNFNSSTPITSWGLTDEGVKLASELAESEVVRNIEMVHSSLEIKSLETAVIIAKKNGLNIQTDSRFSEITTFTNRIFPNFEEYAETFFTDKVERWNSGESKVEALTRFQKALDECVKIEEGKGRSNIAIVTHGAILALFGAQFTKQPIWEIHKKIKQPDIALFDTEKQQFLQIQGKVCWWEFIEQ